MRTREQTDAGLGPRNRIESPRDAFSFVAEMEIWTPRETGPSRSTPTPYVEACTGGPDRENPPARRLVEESRNRTGGALHTPPRRNQMRYDPLSNTDIAVMARLTRLGHAPEEAHGATVLLYLLEAVGSEVRVRPDHVVELAIPEHLDARLRSDPEADRMLRDMWPALTNAVRARDTVHWEWEREKRERNRRERLQAKFIHIGDLFRQQAEAWRPHPDDVREWYRRKAQEKAES